MLFSTEKPAGRTVLLLDVENGSVAAGLVRLAPDTAPKLFGETRVHLRILPTRDSMSLLHEVGQGVRHALTKVAEVASRLRNAPGAGTLAAQTNLQQIGTVSHAALFLAAPWGVPNIGAGEPAFTTPLAERIQRELGNTFGPLPQSTHTAAGAAFAGVRQLLPYDDSYLLCTISGELTELTLVAGGVVVGYATIPMGRHSAVRTLRAHASATEHEALSALRLAKHGNTPSPYMEPLEVAAHDYATHVADALAKLIAQSSHRPERVYVVSHADEGEWFARSLAASGDMGSLLPGGVIRTLQPKHAKQYLSAHAESPDLMLMLEAFFADAHL